VLLAGGSAFGLDAAGGVMRWLDERGIGVPVGSARGACRSCRRRSCSTCGRRREHPPDAAPATPPAMRRATRRRRGQRRRRRRRAVGKLFGIDAAMRGGLGSASITVDGITVAALVAVNAIGDVIDPRTGARRRRARADGGSSSARWRRCSVANRRTGRGPAWRRRSGSSRPTRC
jgi:hypothetical protein